MRATRLVPLLMVLAASTALPAQVVPHRVPAPGELLDSAAFAAFARTRAGGARGDVVLSLVFDSAGTLASARAVGGKAPEALKSVLADSVVGYLRPQAPWAGGYWWTRVSVRLAPEPALRTQAAHVRGPAPMSSLDVRSMFPAGAPSPTGRIELRFLVSETGRVLRVEPGAGTTITPSALAQLTERVRYVPGTVDGVPEPMWVAVRLERTTVRTR